MKLPGKIFVLLLSFSLMSGFLVMPITEGAGIPHAINGFVRDLNSNGIWDATVYVNHTFKNATGSWVTESISQQTDEMGRYSIGIDGYPSGYLNGDLLNVTAVYYHYSEKDNITVTPDPTQQIDFVLAMQIHTIEGTIYKPDGSGARYFSVNITNQDKNEYLYAISDNDGHYRMDLSRFLNGYDVNDDITVSVLFVGFTGSNSSIITSNYSDNIDVYLTDIEPPSMVLYESPTNITLNSFFRILLYVDDNTNKFSASLFIKSPGEFIFTEMAMIPDDGVDNDWDSDGMPDSHIFGQSTIRNIPQQSLNGIFEYYFLTNDSAFTVTLPDIDPVNNAYEIEILDLIEPTLAHDHVWLAEAGQTVELIATADDNIGLDSVNVYLEEVGESVFTQHSMTFTGIPKQYNFTVPAQTYPGAMGYYLVCTDTSNNTARVPISGAYTIDVRDTIAPAITHLPINSINVNDPVNFTCQIVDLIAINSVWLNFTDVHGNETNVSMIDAGSGNWYYLATGQDINGTLYYTIWANDSSGNLAMESHAAAVNDIGTPLIFHDAPEYFDYNVSTNITVYVEDDVTIADVSLAYESVGASGFTVIPMASWDSTGTQGNYSAIIPAQNLGSMRYYINATDGTNNISWPAVGPPYEIEVLDMELPVITPGTYLAIRTSPGDVTLTANVTDNHEVNEVNLHYLNSTSQSWINVSMVPVDVDASGSGRYEGIIPGHIRDVVKFYYSANDSSENNITNPGSTPKLNSYSLIFLDYSSPSIEMYYPASTGVNSTTEIIINAIDDQEIASVQLYFNGTEDEAFTQIILSKLENGTYRGILPPQNLSGDIQIYASASDGANINETQTFSILVINQPPEVQHIGVESAPVGDNVAMVAQVYDDLHVDNVIFSWRPIGESQYSNLTMVQTVIGTYRADLSFEDALIIQYHINAFDAENSTTWPDGPDHEISIMDLEAPIIIHEPLVQLNVSSRPIISATVSDNQQVFSVTLWYKNASASTFYSASMSPVSNLQDTYTALLGLQPEGNFTYYIQATDGINSVETQHYTVEVLEISGTDWTSIIMFSVLMIFLVIAAIIVLMYLSGKSFKSLFQRKQKPIKEEDNPPEK